MKFGDNFTRHTQLDIPGIYRAFSHLTAQLVQFGLRNIRQRLKVAHHRVIRQRHELPKHLVRGRRDGNIIAQGLTHLFIAIQPNDQLHGQNLLRGLPKDRL